MALLPYISHSGFMDLWPCGRLLATFLFSVSHFSFSNFWCYHDHFAGIGGTNMRVFYIGIIFFFRRLEGRLGNDAES